VKSTRQHEYGEKSPVILTEVALLLYAFQNVRAEVERSVKEKPEAGNFHQSSSETALAGNKSDWPTLNSFPAVVSNRG